MRSMREKYGSAWLEMLIMVIMVMPIALLVSACTDEGASQLAGAIFEWIECWYNPARRHSYNDGLSPTDYETANAA